MEILSILNGRWQTDFLSDYLRALHVCVCMCVVDGGKLVNTQLVMLFDTPGGPEDISHFFYTCVVQCTFSSSSSLHLIYTIFLHPSLTAVTWGESTHPQL